MHSNRSVGGPAGLIIPYVIVRAVAPSVNAASSPWPGLCIKASGGGDSNGRWGASKIPEQSGSRQVSQAHGLTTQLPYQCRGQQ